jgi:hypothetical protein
MPIFFVDSAHECTRLCSILGRHGEMLETVFTSLSEDEWDVRKEAAWVLSNMATGGTHELVR